MIRRTLRDTQKKYLKENKNLKILDLGCSFVNYWPEANHFADIDDFTEGFAKKNLKFTKIEIGKKLPFQDKEFDYIILSHVMEHVENIEDFKKEIERVGKSGYIELPTKLNDNLVFGCDDALGHKWWFEFDDDTQKLKYARKVDALEKFMSVGSITKFTKIFEESLILSFYWENSIDLEKREKFSFDEKITFKSLIKKYVSKKIRDVLSKFKVK